MKIIFIVLITFLNQSSLYGQDETARIQDIRARLSALKHKKQSIRAVVNVANPIAWLRDNIYSMDHILMETNIIAIEAKDVVLVSDYKIQNDDEVARKEGMITMRVFFKNYDCSTLGAFNKKVCQYIKHKR